jgi:transcriptional regulator with XRE-family HTH domain
MLFLKAGLSQSHLAGRAGVPLGSPSQIEQGHRPNHDVLTTAKLTDALGMTIDQLTGRVDR